MLRGLKIENIAVIESAELNFYRGLNILTGETGAGKSIIIDSLNAVLGERTSRDLIRDGCDNAKVFAEFTDVNSEVNRILDEYGIEKTEDSSLIINRQISLSGKNSCRINGTPVTVSQLKEIGNELINIHGQHDSQSLLSPEKHCGFIDLMADNASLKQEYKIEFDHLKDIKHKLDNLYDTRDESTSKLDYLNYVIKEISDADLKVNESDSLNKERTLLQNSVKVRKNIDKAYLSLSGDNGIYESLMECAEYLKKASEYYDDIKETADSVKSLALDLGECTHNIKSLSDRFVYSPERLSEIDERLDLIYRLSMKYGKTEADILETLDNSIAERAEIEVSDDKIKELEDELYSSSDKVKNLAKKLTESRKKAAIKFEKSVSAELSYLDMPYVKFVVDLKSVPLSSKGAEAIEFLISTNAGQEPKSISKIASGGELSRIMLAIKNVLTDKDNVDTLIFDEVDAGVSGSAAEKIALKLGSVSRGRQVICITHLARIAAQADNHLKIIKEMDKSGTFTKVYPLDFEGRAAELARITAGNSVTELQLETAREMLKKAKETLQ